MEEPSWRLWQKMAQESFDAGELAIGQRFLRSAASRLYYAAYQAITALLLYRNLTPPEEYEAWSHEDTPGLIEDHLTPIIRARDQRRNLSRRLRALYSLRLEADYRAQSSVETMDVDQARRDAGFILSNAKRILPKQEIS
jgi:uncharacterized protein (UPF0332 family)